MAFEVKYRTEFTDDRNIDWKTDILEDGFSGSITTLTGTGEPLRFQYDNGSDSVFDPITESRALISVWSDTNFALSDLYSLELRHFKVNIYAGVNLYWTGWIEPHHYEEVYEPVSYSVVISATDGLSELVNIKYLNSGAYYTGRKYESQIVLDILGEIGHTSFYEYVNIYDDQMLNSVDDSPYDQTMIDSECFKDYNCADVLTELLKKYNAVIRHKDGHFHIFRPKELVGSTVYGRNFTAATTKSSVTITPQQYINRTGYASDRWQVPGGTLMIEAPYEKVNINHDYGNRDSWVNNYDFDGETYDGTNFDDWTIGAGVASPISNLIPGETKGVYITPNNTGYISQSFGSSALTSASDTFKISFDYLVYNEDVVAINDIEILIKINQGAHWLVEQDEKECHWTTEDWLNQSIFEDAQPGSSGWKTWERKFTSLPADGPYVITLYAPNNSDSDIYVAFKNIRFFATSITTTMKQILLGYVPEESQPWYKLRRLKPVKSYLEVRPYVPVKREQVLISNEYEATNAINGHELNFGCALGDVIDANMLNVPQQFKGSLAYYPIQARVDVVHLVGESGTANITCNGLTKLATFSSTNTQTATAFVTAHASAYDAIGVTVTSSGAYISFTAKEEGVDFTGDTTIENVSGDLTGTVTEDTPSRVSQLRATSLWSKRAGAESKTLLQLIADEIAEMYNKPKQLIQMPIWEPLDSSLSINILGNFQDTINTYSGAVRVFSMNRGEFNVKPCEWSIDLFEIGTGAVVETETVKTIKYGFLYNWYAVNTGMLAASGWNVPTLDEWNTLLTYLDPLTSGYYSDYAGADLKETGTTYWDSPNTGATNATLFNARGAGNRAGTTGFFSLIKEYCQFIASDDLGGDNNANVYLENTSTIADGGSGGWKKDGQSIRLTRLATVAEQLLTDGTACADYVQNDGLFSIPTVKIGTQVWTAANLCETKYSDGTDIPLVKGILMWVGTTEGAYCYYDNDITNAYTESEQVINSSSTGDSTVVTVDSTTITSDSTV